MIDVTLVGSETNPELLAVGDQKPELQGTPFVNNPTLPSRSLTAQIGDAITKQRIFGRPTSGSSPWTLEVIFCLHRLLHCLNLGFLARVFVSCDQKCVWVAAPQRHCPIKWLRSEFTLTYFTGLRVINQFDPICDPV